MLLSGFSSKMRNHRLLPEPRRACVALLALFAVAASHGPSASAAAQEQGLEEGQLILLREAFHLVSQVGSELWTGWANVPLAVLIIDDKYEFLVTTPPDWHPSPAFVTTEQRFLGRPVYRRRATLPRALRAAFPIDGLPAAVVGAWQPKEESPNEWAVTLVHEWFHVLQMNRDEQTKVGQLALGRVSYPSLQLDYPFAYGDDDIGNAIHLLGQALYDFWSRSRTLPRAVQRTFVAQTAWAALQNLETVVTLKYGKEAYSYFRYQTWKEGVARYSQVKVSLHAADKENHGHFRPMPGFSQLQGNMSYARLWEEVTRTNYWMMRTPATSGAGDPTSFYGIGHGLAELLDVIHPDWKERYFEPGVWLDDLIEEVMDPENAGDR